MISNLLCDYDATCDLQPAELNTKNAHYFSKSRHVKQQDGDWKKSVYIGLFSLLYFDYSFHMTYEVDGFHVIYFLLIVWSVSLVLLFIPKCL